MTFAEFLLALAPSEGVPGKPSHELDVGAAERIYDLLAGLHIDHDAVLSGRFVSLQWVRRQWHREMLSARGIEKACDGCGGSGVKGYSNTSGWRNGAGGQTLTTDVCDQCWGSGDKHNHWANLRELEGKLRSRRRDDGQD